MIELDSPKAQSSRSLTDIRSARENRTAEVIRIKDEQIRILTEQNNKLLDAIEKGEEEISALQLEKLHIDEENRELRESNFCVQSKSKVRDDELESTRIQTEELEKQLQVVTSQHAELLKMVESEEATNARLVVDLEGTQSELQTLRVSQEIMKKELAEKVDIAETASKKCETQNSEIILLRDESASLKTKLKETMLKCSVETESLQEQLRVRKEKQYQLLEKLQIQEEARRKAEDQISLLEEDLKSLHMKSSSTDTQLQIEISARLSQSDENQKLSQNNEILKGDNNKLREKYKVMEEAQLKMESDARLSSEKLREMAEKVFQLLERLKIAELGKTRAMEALRGKEDEVHSLKKKIGSQSKEYEKEETVRMKLQQDKKVLEEQLKNFKKQHTKLACKCKEEARLKIRMEDEKKEAENKVKTLNGRVSFLLNKLQVDEEARSIQKEEIEKLQNQLQSTREAMQHTEKDLDKALNTIKSLTEELKAKTQELETTKIKQDALEQFMDEQDSFEAQSRKREKTLKSADESPLLAGGRLRFTIDSKPSLGLFALKAKSARDKKWLETNDCNLFMRKASKSSNTQDILLQKIAETYGIIVSYEEEIEKLKKEIDERNALVEKIELKNKHIHDKLSIEEESKRRTLLRYINAVKASVSLGEAGCEKDREEVGKVGAGRINLPEANLTDEEVHAISALLRNNETIALLNLQGNLITDEGCRSIASVLSGPSCLEHIDLRRNRISKNGIKLIVEAIERSDRVRHVHVHAGGKIEAVGSKNLTQNFERHNKVESSTVCVIDIRENSKPEDSDLLKEEMFDLQLSLQETQNRVHLKKSSNQASKSNQKSDKVMKNGLFIRNPASM